MAAEEDRGGFVQGGTVRLEKTDAVVGGSVESPAAVRLRKFRQRPRQLAGFAMTCPVTGSAGSAPADLCKCG